MIKTSPGCRYGDHTTVWVHPVAAAVHIFWKCVCEINTKHHVSSPSCRYGANFVQIFQKCTVWVRFQHTYSSIWIETPITQQPEGVRSQRRALFHTTEANSDTVALGLVQEASETASASALRQPKLAVFLFHFTQMLCTVRTAIDFNHAFFEIMVLILHTHLRVWKIATVPSGQTTLIFQKSSL